MWVNASPKHSPKNTEHVQYHALDIDGDRELLFDGPLKAPQPYSSPSKTPRGSIKSPRKSWKSAQPQRSPAQDPEGTLPGLDAHEHQKVMNQQRPATSEGGQRGGRGSFAAPPSRGQRAATARARHPEGGSPDKRGRATGPSESPLGSHYGFRKYTPNVERQEEFQSSQRRYYQDPEQQQMIYAPPSARKRLQQSKSAWLARTALAGPPFAPSPQ